MQNVSRGEVLKKGEKIYLETLRKVLEPTHTGAYVAIDVDTGQHLVESSELGAIKRAQEEFGDKLFYIVQIGNLSEPTINFVERKNVAWFFS